VTELPTGTVTLLFTDIEGSTRLLERLGEQYVEILYEHRRLLRAAAAEFGGHVVDMEGDASFTAFRTAAAAVAAATAAQQAIAAHPWPPGARPRVRIGIHTGEPVVVATDYAGLDVHRGARICSAAHGGEVLISGPTRRHLHHLPTGVGLRDLGEHRLKDLTQPERLFQVLIADLPVNFPPPRTLQPPAVNLPTQLTQFVGRHRELAESRALLEHPEVRLLTLTGAGGTGKTRLAVRLAGDLAAHFPDGVSFVELAQVADPRLVIPAIAQVVKVTNPSSAHPLESLIHHVQHRDLLLVLDTFEQVLAAAPTVVDLLRACPRLTVVVTSRAALDVSGEHVYSVPPLSLPEAQSEVTLDELMRSEAAILFVERARAVDPSFVATAANAQAVAEICHRLDGLPLAIELAAARSRVLSPPALLSRLERRLQLLQGGARDLPARQQTLRSTIDWSYDLLDPRERSLFARLAVFAGGCGLEAAEHVGNTGNDPDVLAGLEALVRKNLVQSRAGPEGEPRLLMLDTVREYALERLAERSDAATVGRRHADFYRELAEHGEAELMGSWQGGWYERLESDLDNFRAALSSSLAGRQADTVARIAAALTPLWESRGHVTEGVRWLDVALRERQGLSQHALAKALFAKSYLLLHIEARRGQAEGLLEESLAIFRALGETAWTIRVISVLGQTAIRARDFELGLALREQAVTLARSHEDKWVLAMAVRNLGLSLLQAERHDRARAALREALTLHQSFGDQANSAHTLDGLGMLALAEGDLSGATAFVEEALALARKLGHVLDTADFLADLGLVALEEDDYRRAGILFAESLRVALPIEDELSIAQCLWGYAALSAVHGSPVRAVRLWAAATTLRYELTAPPSVIRPIEQRLLEPTRAALGRPAFDAEWREGRTMERAVAVEFALDRR
jgi:predicted ATPase/Flp pilus assembly protein TadD